MTHMSKLRTFVHSLQRLCLRHLHRDHIVITEEHLTLRLQITQHVAFCNLMRGKNKRNKTESQDKKYRRSDKKRSSKTKRLENF